ncbi:MAG: MBL fold metallo-hydrolase, partial [Deltaproteobacteria bacterium]|nr:MBL fold metallo-hydrolase [Deltaproteobacteria bacterium]
MRFSVLASGSGGNACYIETDYSRILIDAGLSCREIIRRMEILDVSPVHFDALFITHEHHDHIKAAGPISRRFNTHIHINNLTMQRVKTGIGRIAGHIPFETGQTIKINDLTIETFTKCHDAADPVGLVVSSNGSRLGIITDAGRSTRLLEDRLRGCRALIIEFNHDEAMLEQGPYPLHLKRRIRGSEGHLSNREAGELLKTLMHSGLRHI